MAEDQDKGYRLLFSFPRMVEDLIRLYVGGEWVERLDFSSLEKVSERDVSPELIRREKDLLWRLRIRPQEGRMEVGDWFYVYLHLEFESRNSHFMAVRVMTYRLLLWEDLIRQKALTRSGKLPPAISVVVYTGERPWTGPTSIVELIEPLPGAPEGYDPLSYRLIEEQSYSAAELDAEASPVSGLFLVERRGSPEDLVRVARAMARGLPGPENRVLREALGTYVGYRFKKLDPELEFPPKIDLVEVPSMLEQRVTEWAEQWKRDGLREGRRKGLQEGRQEGEAMLLLRLLERKFGDLPASVLERVESADSGRLLEWGERVLTASSLQEVLEDDHG